MKNLDRQAAKLGRLRRAMRLLDGVGTAMSSPVLGATLFVIWLPLCAVELWAHAGGSAGTKDLVAVLAALFALSLPIGVLYDYLERHRDAWLETLTPIRRMEVRAAAASLRCRTARRTTRSPRS